MFKVYISEKSLSDLYLDNTDKGDNDWLKIIAKQSKIQLFNTQDEINDILTTPESLIREFMMSCGKSSEYLCSSEITIDSIKEDYSAVLDSPSGAFLLDVDKETADSIQKKYGVLCQSTSDLSYCALTSDGGHYVLSFKEKESWERLTENIKSLPSNFLIINDKYLFSKDDKNNPDRRIGIDNVKSILDNLLPISLDADYHIAIITELKEKRDKMPFDDVANELDVVKRSLNRNYRIFITLIGVYENSLERKDITHDRNIVSNYFVGMATKGLAAINTYYATSQEDQRVSFEPLFCWGLNGNSDAPVKEHERLIKNYRSLVEDENNIKNLRIACSVNTNAAINNINHRALISSTQKSCTIKL